MNVDNDIRQTIPVGIDVIHKRFQDLYISLRNSEKRIYSDEEVLQLPEVPAGNLYREEWKIRKESSNRLVNYLGKKKNPLRILEVGCGNGWLTHQISLLPNAVVTGIDINLVELEQASRVFANQANLNFIYGDISSGKLLREKFDIIVFAATVQYFQSFRGLMFLTLDLLNEDGEIHILDSHFYSLENIAAAKERSEQYFKQMGFEKMGKHYFHHSLEELELFHYEILYDANTVLNKLLKNKNPFKWICIKSKK